MPQSIGLSTKTSGSIRRKVSEYNTGTQPNATDLKKPPSTVSRFSSDRGLDDEKKSGKKPLHKPKKAAEDADSKTTKNEKPKEGKRAVSSIVDRVPKKTAQRTKGSLSLGKHMDKADVDSLGKGRPPSSEHESRPVTRGDSVEETDLAAKSKTSDRSTRVRRKKLKEGDVPANLLPGAPKTRKPWVSVVDKKSAQCVEAEDEEAKEEEVPPELKEMREEKSEELATLQGLPSSSCSFFEKLQQGVRAYFSSRSSFDDKNKKKVTEGGIRERGGVAKGPKEEPKKRNPNVTNRYGKNKKSKKVNSESGLSNGCRLYLKSGGESQNCLATKPKILRKFRQLKRKKLYRPKKHYVRIQIPRKGYFYRSIVHLKDPEPASLPNQRVEPENMRKPEPKVQVPRVASASVKGSDIRQKRVARKKSAKKATPRKDAEDDQVALQILLDSLTAHEGIPYRPEYLEHMSNLLMRTQKVSDALEGSSGVDPREVGRLVAEGLASALEGSPSKEGESRTSAVSENPKAKKKAKVPVKKKSTRVYTKEEEADFLSENNVPQETFAAGREGEGRNAGKPSTMDSKSFQGFLSYLDEAKQRRELGDDLEVSLVGKPSEELATAALIESFQMMFQPIPCREPALDRIAEEPAPAEIGDCLENVGPKTPVPLGKSKSDYRQHLFWLGSEDNLRASLMNDIDLHGELQDYLKSSKAPKMFKSNSDLVLRKDFHDLNDDDDSGSFTSAAFNSPSYLQDQVHSDRKPDEVDDQSRDSSSTKTFFSQSSQGTEEVRKIKSENAPGDLQLDLKSESFIKRTFGRTSFQSLRLEDIDLLTKNPHLQVNQAPMQPKIPESDDYEKIFPFANPLDKKEKKSKSSVLYKNLVYSFSVDSFRPNAPNAVSDVTRADSTPSTHIWQTSSVPEIAAPKSDGKKRWSPSLKELIVIYNSILRQSQSQSGRNSIKRCVSAQIISFLKCKLKERKYQNQLRSLSSSFTPPNWRRVPEGKAHEASKALELKKYVDVFQEVLSSSLTIDQISKINDIMADLQLYMDTKQSKVKKPKAKDPKKSEDAAKEKLGTKKSEEGSRKVNLSSPKELGSFLQSCFPSSPPDSSQSTVRGKDQKNKVLVSVKLFGNQVLVDNMSYFNNEKSLKSTEKAVEGNASQLIIENVERTRPTSVSPPQSIRKRIPPRPTVVHPVVEKKPKPCASVKIVKKPPAKPKKPGSPPKNVKATKKAVKVEAPVTVLPPAEGKKTVRKFEYDQEMLKMQHPIEAIIESSESKIDETENADCIQTKIREIGVTTANPPEFYRALREALELALTNNFIFSKDLCEFNTSFWSAEGPPKKVSLDRTRSHTIQRNVKEENGKRVDAKAKPAPKKGKSKDDASILKMSNGKRKARTVLPLRARSTFLCYPSVGTGNVIKAKKKGKEVKQERKMPRSKSFSCSKDSKKDFHKKAEELSGKAPKTFANPKNKKTEVKAEAAAPSLGRVETAPEVAAPPSTNTILFLNTGVPPDCCSVEFLFNDRSTNPSLNDGSASSSVDVVEKSALKFPKEPAEKSEAPTTSKTPSDAVSASKLSPIVLHPPSGCDDPSFPSLMIQSDSYLKSHSSFAITRSKVQSLFRSNSDMKFYPGKVDSQGEQNPFITFVLTPKQKKAAGVPSGQVMVVNREDAAVQEEVEPEEDPGEAKESIPLDSIEAFIKVLSKKRLDSHRKKPQSRKSFERKKASPTSMKRLVQGQRLQAASSFDRKPYHECQMRKPTEKPAKKVTTRKRKAVAKVAKKIGKSSETCTINKTDSERDKEFREMSTDAEEGFYETDAEKTEEVEETEDPEQPGCSLSKSPDRRLEKKEMMQLVKKAISKTKGLTKKEEVLKAIERELEKRETMRFLGEKEKVKGGSLKKVKTLKIKIRCNNHGLQGKDPSRSSQKRMRSSFPEEERNLPEALPPSRPTEALNLLESLVSREPEEDLDTQLTYFDAVDEIPDDRSKGAKVKRMEESVQSQSGENPRSRRPRVTLTPSDENLLSKDLLEERWEEKILDKIMKKLESNDVCYSLLLMDGLLKGTKNLSNENNDPRRLLEVLESVENKSKNLMVTIEKNSWQKILTLLQGVLRTFDGSTTENSDREAVDFLTAQVKRTKSFMEKVKMLNGDRFADFQNVYAARNSLGNIVFKVKDSLKGIGSKFLGAAEHDLHSTPQTAQGDANDLPLKSLKREIRQQRLYIQYLVNSEFGPNTLEIQNLKNEVAENMKFLEEKFSSLDRSCGGSGRTFLIKDNSYPLVRTPENLNVRKGGPSFLNIGEACRSLFGRNSEADTPGQRLVKSLVKIWDSNSSSAAVPGGSIA